MKRIYFHIGSEKCGSSFITRFFTSPGPQQELLSRHRIYSSPHVLLETAPLLPFHDKPLEAFGAIRDKYLRPYLSSALDGLFVTQEGFLGLTHGDAPNATAANCRILQYLCQGFEVHPVIVLRRQDTFVESLYNQLVKRGDTRSFPDFLASLRLENYAWHEVVAEVADCFPDVHVIPFEREILRQKGVPGLVEALLVAIGLPLASDPQAFPPMNPSLPLRFLEVQRAANATLPPDQARIFADWLAVTFPKRPDEAHCLFDEKSRRALLQGYARSNARLFERFMPGYDPSYYLTFP